ncbi:MAG TPA: 7TM diverse intracellular signaling domain-containing protein [Sphingobacterium sp.]|nr:7TM diverse intracellular signaling domain-containing protein [Sphingobacterium sp.]
MLKTFGTIIYTILLVVSAAQGQVLIEGEKPLPIKGHNMAVYVAPQDVAVEDIKTGEFKPITSDVPSLGMSKDAVWIRFSLRNETNIGEYVLEISNSTIDKVELYAFDTSDSLLSQVVIDKHKPFFDRKYHNPNFKFDLDIAPLQTQVYYLKVQSNMPIVLPVSILSKPVHVNSLSVEYLILGVYAGIVLIMSIYNFFLFLSIRDISYIYYVFYVLGTGLTQIGIKGHNYQFLWPNSPGIEQGSIVFLGCISGISAILFTINFLEIKKYFRALYRCLMSLLVLFLTAIVVLFIDRYLAFQLMQTVTTLSALFGLGTAIYVVYKRPAFPPAKFFLIAWSILLIGSLIFLLKDYGLLPHNGFTNHVVQAASAIEMALLSFGLANRINMLKREREHSRLEALRVAKENEQLIREQNIVLEQKVEERTHALTETNESLQTALDHLKETQSQLIEAEKMASLGQLTAGVAHEINNPINFVTSNVGPLKRDVKMIWDTLEEVERVAFLDNLSADEKQLRIKAYKDEIDIDYLKTEVDFLLKGMHDGASRTAEIVKSLRIFSRVDEDTLTFADINEGLESAMVILNSAIKDTIDIQKNYGKLPLIECYAGKLNQVFLNILTNAIYAIEKKFLNNIGGKLMIETGIHEEESCSYVKISDNGIGIPEDIRGKLFEPFFTTKDVGEGTGLGMSIAYNTIAKHHGRIIVESIVGEGSTFTLIIPIKQNISAK